MTGVLAPVILTVFDNSGVIAPGAKVFSYATGTAVKQNTYTTALLNVANSNPVIADSAGRVKMFLDPNPSLPAYDFQICPATMTDPPTSNYYSLDNISGAGNLPSVANVDIQVTAGENISTGNWCFMSKGGGGQTAGRWYKTDADIVAASSEAEALGVAMADIAIGATGTVRIEGIYSAAAGLTAGTLYFLSNTAGNLAASGVTHVRAVAFAISTTSYLISFRQFQSNPRFHAGPTAAFAVVSGVHYINVTPVGNVGGGEDDLMTTTLLANFLNESYDGIRVTAWGVVAIGIGGTVKLRAYFGGSILDAARAATFIPLEIGAGTGCEWRTQIDLFRTGAATESYVMSTMSYGGNSPENYRVWVGQGTLAVDLTSAAIVKFTGESSTAANDDIVQNGMMIEVIG